MKMVETFGTFDCLANVNSKCNVVSSSNDKFEGPGNRVERVSSVK